LDPTALTITAMVGGAGLIGLGFKLGISRNGYVKHADLEARMQACQAERRGNEADMHEKVNRIAEGVARIEGALGIGGGGKG